MTISSPSDEQRFQTSFLAGDDEYNSDNDNDDSFADENETTKDDTSYKLVRANERRPVMRRLAQCDSVGNVAASILGQDSITGVDDPILVQKARSDQS